MGPERAEEGPFEVRPALPSDAPLAAADANKAATSGSRSELLGFVMIGVLSYVVDAGLLWLLSGPGGVDVRIAATVAFWTSVLINFTLNRWLFHQSAGGGLRRHTARYAILLGINYFVTLAGLSAAESAGMNIIIAKTAIAAVISVWNFVLYRVWVFR